MQNSIETLLRTDFMPHGHCYLWAPEILWLNVVSDLLIAFAYFSIPIALYYYVKRRPDLQFKGVFFLFSAFILACGVTHLLGIYVIWEGAYGIHGIAKFITAAVSCVTAFMVYKIMPAALQIPSTTQLKLAYEKANDEKLERVKLENQTKQDSILRQSTDSAHIGILVVNRMGIIQIANTSACSIFGYAKHELENQSVNKLVPDLSASGHQSLVEDFFDEQVSDSLMAGDRVVHGITKAGKRIPIEVQLKRSQSTEDPLVFASFQDISERIAAQTEIEKSRSTTRSIIERLPIGLHVYTCRNGQLLLSDYNTAANTTFGITNESFLGNNICQIFHGFKDDPELLQEFIIVASSGGAVERVKIEHIVDDENRISELEAFQSDENTLIVLFEDITELEQAKQELAKKDQIINTAFNSSISSVLVYSVSAEMIEFVNDSFCSTFGYKKRDLEGLGLDGLERLFDNEQLDLLRNHIESLNDYDDETRLSQVEYRIKGGDDQIHYCIAKFSALSFDQHNRVDRFLASILDITEIKNMQQNVTQLKEQAESANAVKNEFLANMSHEIRTPMTSILGLVDLVTSMNLGQREKQYLKRIKFASKSLLAMLTDMLDYAKLEHSRLDLVKRTFNVEDILTHTVSLFRVIAEEKNLSLLLDIQPNLRSHYLGDQLRLSQIIYNLTGNALKYTDAGFVKITMTENVVNQRVYLELMVEDTGPGISHGRTMHQASDTKKPIKSNHPLNEIRASGLGISFAYELTQMLGGQMAYDSELGKGTTFNLRIPVEPIIDANESEIVPATHVLLIDNRPETISIRQNLLTYLQATFELATDEQQIRERVARAGEAEPAFDLILLNWLMDGQDGLLLLEEMAQDEKLGNFIKSTPTVLITSTDANTASQQLKTVTPKAILEEPVLPTDLRSTLTTISQGGDSPNDNEPSVLSGQQIMVVEDDGTNQLLIKELLEQFGCEVTIANNGQSALEIFEQRTFNAILMDLYMPVMDGYVATQHIRQQEKGKNIPIIATSAAVLNADFSDIKSRGFDEVISKPIEAFALFNILKGLLHQPTKPASKRLSEIVTNGEDGLDTASALSNLADNHSLYHAILRSFLNDHEHADKTIDSLLLEEKEEEFDRLLHTIKGLAGSIGATNLQKLIEQGNLTQQTRDPQWLVELKLELNHVILLVRRFLDDEHEG